MPVTPSTPTSEWMRAGAKLVGSIEIGPYCQIGANAVVRTSVPSGCTAVGVPAVVKPRTRVSLAMKA